MFKFENPLFFYAFAIIPVCMAIYIWYVYRTKKNLKKLGELGLINHLAPDVSKAKKTTKFILFLIGISFLILGICNLQTGSKMKDVKREGADIMVCLDVSNSMLAQDLTPNRLDRKSVV